MVAASYEPLNLAHIFMRRNAYVAVEYLHSVPRLETLLSAPTSLVTTCALNIIFPGTVSFNICRKLMFYGDFKQSTVCHFTLSAYEA